MSYRKFQADFLFTGTRMLPSATVLVTDETGMVQDIVDEDAAGEAVECFKGMLTPGFVNTHCHLELSHMKERIPERTGLVDFLTRVIRERNFAPELIRQAMEKAEAELYANGIVAVGDTCNTAASIPVKKTSRIEWRNFIEVLGFSENPAPERFAYFQSVLEAFNLATDMMPGSPHHENQAAGPEINRSSSGSSLSPHSPYSVSPNLFKLINDVSANKIISIHNQESESENMLYRDGSGPILQLYSNLGIDASFFEPSGKTSLQTFLPWLNKAAAIILVHNTNTTEEDLVNLQSKTPGPALFFSVCINANRYIESRNPPLELLRKYNCDLTIGTDSYASNHQLSILDEIKTIQREFGTSIPLTEMLQWSTLNGAKALGLEAKLGSFERGKQPGVLLIDKIQGQMIAEDAFVKRII